MSKEWEIENVMEVLERHVGRSNAILGTELKDFVRKSSANNYPPVRQAVNHIRSNGLWPICSDSNAGYWTAEDENDLEVSIMFLEDRIASQQRAIDGLKKLQGRVHEYIEYIGERE